jgi:hypothetical protein
MSHRICCLFHCDTTHPVTCACWLYRAQQPLTMSRPHQVRPSSTSQRALHRPPMRAAHALKEQLHRFCARQRCSSSVHAPRAQAASEAAPATALETLSKEGEVSSSPSSKTLLRLQATGMCSAPCFPSANSVCTNNNSTDTFLSHPRA